MNQRNNRRANESVFLVLELSYLRDREGASLLLYASKAGAEDVAAREWPLAFGRLDSQQLTDVIGRVAGIVNEQCVMFVGVQDALEL
jgi:hypothetical protein